jgi:hypothetical protein
MAFMIPQYTQEPFWLVETTSGTEAVPASLVGADPQGNLNKWPGLKQFLDGDLLDDEEPELVKERFWARLSAPGFMDCTDWGGPFETLDEAKKYIEETYEVDPESGDRLEDEQ